MFDALEMSLTVLEQLALVETKVRQRRKSLADEIGRAAESVAWRQLDSCVNDNYISPSASVS